MMRGSEPKAERTASVEIEVGEVEKRRVDACRAELGASSVAGKGEQGTKKGEVWNKPPCTILVSSSAKRVWARRVSGFAYRGV
jgi:hypothetical protein